MLEIHNGIENITYECSAKKVYKIRSFRISSEHVSNKESRG